jgi:hypothetical protein
MSLKPWHLIVAGLYLLVLAALAAPLYAIGFWKWPSAEQFAAFFGSRPVWLGLVAMAIAQLVLLLVPLRIVSRRPVTRGALWPTVLVGATMMGLLGLAAAVSVHAAILGDKPEKPWELPLLAALVSGLWGFWTVVFGRLSRKRPPADFLSVLCRRLMQGSILELLVAVPCHIVVRCRDYCCAGLFTMFGLAMGVSVMLFAFGPAVYFLFVARAKRLEALVPKSDELTGNT